MTSKPLTKNRKPAKRRAAVSPDHGSDYKSGEPRSKLLKYDTEVPGDRGECEKESTVQGSE